MGLYILSSIITLDTPLCDQLCQQQVGRWFSAITPVSSTNETDTTQILLKVALSTITTSLSSIVTILPIIEFPEGFIINCSIQASESDKISHQSK